MVCGGKQQAPELGEGGVRVLGRLEETDGLAVLFLFRQPLMGLFFVRLVG
jgi:hypothetical protein